MSFVCVKSLSKYFGANVVLSDLSFSVEAGSCLLIRGANGCGKSTLLSCVSGLLQPDDGTVHVEDISMWSSSGFSKIRREVGLGILPQSNLLYSGLSVEENLTLFSELSCVRKPGGDLLGPLIERLGLSPYRDHRIEQCSQGIARRVGFARALLGSPNLLLLDEPFANLDSAAIAVCTEILGELVDGGCCVLVVSHQIAELRSIVSSTLHFGDDSPREVSISNGLREVQNG